MRRSRLLGVAFFVLIWAGEVAGAGDHPSPTADRQTIADFYVRYSAEQRIGVYLQALAGLTLVMLAAFITSRFRDDTTAVVLTAVSAGNTAAALGVYLGLNAALAFGIGADASADITRAVFQIRAIAETMISFPAALLVGAVAVAARQHRAARLWYVLASGVVAVVLLASGADVARHGFFAPNGDLGFLAFFLLFPLWAAVSGFALIRPRVTPMKPSTQSDARGS